MQAADLVVVGGGYAGLWTALRAKERDPARDVVLLEQGRCGDQASGRNGGFASASLTHGHANGMARWPDEMATLDRLGAENLAAIGETVERHDIDCRWERTGELTVARAAHQVEELAALAESMHADGHDALLLDETATRARVDSPAYRGAIFEPDATVMVEPARLAWGLRAACLRAGVRLHEGTRVTGVERDGVAMRVVVPAGEVRAGRVVLATNAFPPLLRRLRLMTVPVYDYALMTEPLDAAQRAAVGWSGREGVSDASNMFHYYRLTRDDRILWGGYDAVYHYGSRIRADLEQSGPTHDQLARNFFADVPAARGAAVHAPVGRRHRHLHPVRRVLRHGVRRAGGLRPGLHRTGGGRDPVRGRRHARPARRCGHRTHPAAHGARAPGAVPAGAGALRRGAADPLVDGPR